jgi:hypothetical protein
MNIYDKHKVSHETSYVLWSILLLLTNDWSYIVYIYSLNGDWSLPNADPCEKRKQLISTLPVCNSQMRGVEDMSYQNYHLNGELTSGHELTINPRWPVLTSWQLTDYLLLVFGVLLWNLGINEIIVYEINLS